MGVRPPRHDGEAQTGRSWGLGQNDQTPRGILAAPAHFLTVARW